jgi:hypothetical protein
MKHPKKCFKCGSVVHEKKPYRWSRFAQPYDLIGEVLIYSPGGGMSKRLAYRPHECARPVAAEVASCLGRPV